MGNHESVNDQWKEGVCSVRRDNFKGEKTKRRESKRERINKLLWKPDSLVNFGGIPNTSDTSDGTIGNCFARRRARIRDNFWDLHKQRDVCVHRGSNNSKFLLSGICSLRTSNRLLSVSQILRSKRSDGKAIAGTRGEAPNARVHPEKDRRINDIE